jgi:hypothetical protein
MSLINEALKKAQKQRTGEAPPLASMPAIGGESPARIARRAKPAPFNALLLRLGLGLVGLAVVVAGGLFLLRGKSTPEAPAAPKSAVSSPVTKPQDEPAVASAKAGAPAASAATPAKTTPAPAVAKSSENVFVLPIAPPPEPVKTEPAKPVATTPKPETAKPVAAAPKPEKPATETARPAPTARLEPRAIQYIENLKVAGIRASATDSKVLMNDRVYRVGNTVEHEMGLKLVEITANSLTFEDERGGRYTRNF